MLMHHAFSTKALEKYILTLYRIRGWCDLVMPVTTLAPHDIIYKIGKMIDGLVCSLLIYLYSPSILFAMVITSCR